MTIDRLKNEIEIILGSYSNKVTFSKKIGKRNEFLFSLGETNFLPSEIIWENNEYILTGEEIGVEVKEKLRKILEVTYEA